MSDVIWFLLGVVVGMGILAITTYLVITKELKEW